MPKKPKTTFINKKSEANFKKIMLKKTLLERYTNQKDIGSAKYVLYSKFMDKTNQINQIQREENNKSLPMTEQRRWIRQVNTELIDQKKLKDAKVACFGVGGIGTNALMGLEYSGVQNFRIIDYDQIDISNLNRQTFYTPADVGKQKVKIAERKMREINPNINIESFNAKVDYPPDVSLFEMDKLNSPALYKRLNSIIQWADYVINALDYKGDPYLINDLCILNQKPYYWGGVNRFFCDIFGYKPQITPCLRCIVAAEGSYIRYRESGDIEKVDKSANLGTSVIKTGNMIAELLIHDICGLNELVENDGKYLIYDSLALEIHKIPINIKDGCICQKY